MIHKVWRLSENTGDDNLGLACTERGLVLGRTALLERHDTSFVVRERSELEHLLGCAYRTKLSVDRLMPGLATVASALNANDQALARIAARRHAAKSRLVCADGRRRRRIVFNTNGAKRRSDASLGCLVKRR
jgi:hypothetical protein